MTSPAAPVGAPGRALPNPRLRTGVRLMGPMLDTGFQEEQFLLRSPDGQFCRLSPLLYRTVEGADGTRDAEAMAEYVSVAVGKRVSADNIEWLLRERLGWLVATGDEDDGATTPAPSGPPTARDPLLGLRFRKAVVGELTMKWVATPLQFLFTAPAVVSVVLLGLVTNWWLWQPGRFRVSAEATVSHPFGPLAVLLLFLLGTVFHEIGHATALKKGGGTPGVMGVGLYLAWPAFYTDVTDSYRLPRWSRVRVDLGGIYFNLIFSLMMCGMSALTGFLPLLLVAGLVLIEAIHQLLPLVRLDGYWILADMLGVPDLFSHIKTHVDAVKNSRKGQGSTRLLLRKGPARAFSIYVVTVMPIMMLFLGVLVFGAPRVVVGALSREASFFERIGQAALHGNEVELLLAGFQSLLLLLGPIAICLSLGFFFKRTMKSIRKFGAVSPRRRLMASGLSLALVLGLFFVWVPADVRARVPGGIVSVTKSIGQRVAELTDRDNPTIQKDAGAAGGAGGDEAGPRRAG